MQVYKWHHTASWEFLVSSAPRKSPRGMVFFVATARRSMRADSGSFAKALCQDSCQYVNYCLRALSRAFTKSLAVRLFARTSPLLLCFNFSQLRQNHCRAEGTACSKVRTGCSPLTWEYCTPSFPSGFPPPLVKSAALLKCGIYFSSFLIKFESRIEIIERRTE